MNHLDSVDKYDIAANEWSNAPSLNKQRCDHSCCALGDSIYVFCGVNQNGFSMNSIECLDAGALIRGLQVTWQLISLSKGRLSRRSATLVAPFSQTEIIILGGLVKEGKPPLGDGYILNTQDMSLAKVMDSSLFKFSASKNVSCMTKSGGQVYGIVEGGTEQDLNSISRLVAYSRD